MQPLNPSQREYMLKFITELTEEANCIIIVDCNFEHEAYFCTTNTPTKKLVDMALKFKEKISEHS